MRIPEEEYLTPNSKDTFGQRMIDRWEAEASRLSLRTGVFIKVGCDYYTTPASTTTGFVSVAMYISRIYFKVMDQEFESLMELKRAIKLKAFL